MGQAAMVGTDAPVVRVQDFVKRYRKQTAVDGASLSIERGEIYGLIGPDGAGKSSLMKAIAGVLSFEGGTLQVFGEKIDSEIAAERVKGRLGFMPQGLGLNLYPELSIEENIDFFAELRDVPPAELARRKHKLLAMTRLDNFRDRPMKQLSGGMKQKLGLVCTLIHEPELIILDEPTTGVDPVSRRDFWMILTQLLRERGVTALVSTAYMDEAARFHRLSLMFDGRVLIEGEPDVILREVPGALEAVMRHAGYAPATTDALVLHQANRFILSTLAKKAGFTEAQTPMAVVERYGNQSSASIPCALIDGLGDRLSAGPLKVAGCGFGVGLSWGAFAGEIGPLTVAPILPFPR